MDDRVTAKVDRYEIDEEHGFVRMIGVDTLTGEPFQQVVAAPDMALALKEYCAARHSLIKKSRQGTTVVFERDPKVQAALDMFWESMSEEDEQRFWTELRKGADDEDDDA